MQGRTPFRSRMLASVILASLVLFIWYMVASPVAAQTELVTASLQNIGGIPLGQVTLTQLESWEIRVQMWVGGFQPVAQGSSHRVALTQNGVCQGEAFAGAGADVVALPGLQLYPDGTGEYNQVVTTIPATLLQGGTALVIYSDHRPENYGERIACAVLAPATVAPPVTPGEPPAPRPTVTPPAVLPTVPPAVPAPPEATPAPPAVPGPGGIVNGDFESGNAGWMELTLQEQPLITHRDDLPVPPYEGNWAAWLGGADEEVSLLQQMVTVPAGQPYLHFYGWSISEDFCGYDFVAVGLDGEIVDIATLCEENNTNGWVQFWLDMSELQGVNLLLQFAMVTDDSLVSSFFIDNVHFSANPGPQAEAMGYHLYRARLRAQDMDTFLRGAGQSRSLLEKMGPARARGPIPQ
jgi:hypothetical protein